MIFLQGFLILLVTATAFGSHLPTVIESTSDEFDAIDTEDTVPVSGFQTETKSIPHDMLQEMEVINVNGRKAYYAGYRVSGDRLVAHDAKNQHWPSLKNVAAVLKFPPSGYSRFYVTYVYCDVNQSSDLGRAYITGGGIGQHYIYFKIEAYSTTYMNYACQVYGK